MPEQTVRTGSVIESAVHKRLRHLRVRQTT